MNHISVTLNLDFIYQTNHLRGNHKIFLGITFTEFVTQTFADVMRGLSFAWPWLAMCQYFFLVWGTILAIMIPWFLKALWDGLSPPMRRRMRRFATCTLASSASACVLTGGTVYVLFFETGDGDDVQSTYFTCMTIMRCFEVATFVFLTAAVFPNNIIEGLARLSAVARSSTKFYTRQSQAKDARADEAERQRHRLEGAIARPMAAPTA